MISPSDCKRILSTLESVEDTLKLTMATPRRQRLRVGIPQTVLAQLRRRVVKRERDLCGLVRDLACGRIVHPSPLFGDGPG